jgi:ketosteroid isomerase-like protein
MNKSIRLLTFLASTALIISSCATKEEEVVLDMENVKIEILAMEDAYAAGEKAKDVDAVLAYYSDDAINYSRNRSANKGKAAIRESIAKNIAGDTIGSYNVYKIVDVFADGDMVVEIGSWTQFDSIGNEEQNGNFMSYFKKHEGKYRCVRDMSTTTSPAKEAM